MTPIPLMQRCGRCKVSKPLTDYAPSHQYKRGTWCRSCHAAYARGEARTYIQHVPLVCTWCGKEYVPKALKAKAAYCSRSCKDRARSASAKQRDRHLIARFGITQADYLEMLNKQKGGCALCGKKPEEQTRYTRYLDVDHCDKTKLLRGLLCNEHNMLLGRWNHDPVLLRRSADYLEGKELNYDSL